MHAYVDRIIDKELKDALHTAGAVLLEGPRGCGKTETARKHANSAVLLDTDESARILAEVDPLAVLEGTSPRLIDEWQLEPRLWNYVRRLVDDRRAKGQFILTGSALPADEHLRHSGAARILRLRMRPMTLAETGVSSAQVSLQSLMNGDEFTPRHDEQAPTVSELATPLARGGWPGMQDLDAAAAQRLLRSYLEDVARIDVPKLKGGERRNTALIRRTMNSLARHVATEVTNTVIASDVGGAQGPLRLETVAEYLELLERVFMIEMQPSWGPHLRSRDRIRKSAKLHFVDPALAVAGLGGSPESLLKDMSMFGLLFESLVVRDPRVYAQHADASVSHYRDSAGTEVDAIVTAADGRWLALEVKLGTAQEDLAAVGLLRFKEKIDTRKTPPPAALVVISTGKYAYQRGDGVVVVPLTMLGP